MQRVKWKTVYHLTPNFATRKWEQCKAKWKIQFLWREEKQDKQPQFTTSESVAQISYNNIHKKQPAGGWWCFEQPRRSSETSCTISECLVEGIRNSQVTRILVLSSTSWTIIFLAINFMETAVAINPRHLSHEHEAATTVCYRPMHTHDKLAVKDDGVTNWCSAHEFLHKQTILAAAATKLSLVSKVNYKIIPQTTTTTSQQKMPPTSSATQ